MTFAPSTVIPGWVFSSTLQINIHWKDWCWSWNSNTLAIWCEEPTHWKRHWCWERLKAGGEEDKRGWDGWMATPTWWTWVWVSSGSWWWTGKPGMLQSMELQSWTQLSDWTELREAQWPIKGHPAGRGGSWGWAAAARELGAGPPGLHHGARASRPGNLHAFLLGGKARASSLSLRRVWLQTTTRSLRTSVSPPEIEGDGAGMWRHVSRWPWRTPWGGPKQPIFGKGVLGRVGVCSGEIPWDQTLKWGSATFRI